MLLPNETRIIPLTNNLVAIVDAADYEVLTRWKWQAQWNPGTRSYYAKRRGGFQMHRDILGLQKGDKRKGDHINHDTLNNTRGNLRICTHSQNLFNMRTSTRNRSGVKGVSWDKVRNGWLAKIYVNGRQIELGRFPEDQLDMAIAVRKAGEVKYFGEFAHQEAA